MTVDQLIELLQEQPGHHPVKVDGRVAVEVHPGSIGNSPAVVIR